MAEQEKVKVTLFLYQEDIETMQKRFGYGWSARVREVIHQWLKPKMLSKTHASREE